MPEQEPNRQRIGDAEMLAFASFGVRATARLPWPLNLFVNLQYERLRRKFSADISTDAAVLTS